METGRKRTLEKLNPIRDVMMGNTVYGHFGVQMNEVGFITRVSIPTREGPTLVITTRSEEKLEVRLEV